MALAISKSEVGLKMANGMGVAWATTRNPKANQLIWLISIDFTRFLAPSQVVVRMIFFHQQDFLNCLNWRHPGNIVFESSRKKKHAQHPKRFPSRKVKILSHFKGHYMGDPQQLPSVGGETSGQPTPGVCPPSLQPTHHHTTGVIRWGCERWMLDSLRIRCITSIRGHTSGSLSGRLSPGKWLGIAWMASKKKQGSKEKHCNFFWMTDMVIARSIFRG